MVYLRIGRHELKPSAERSKELRKLLSQGIVEIPGAFNALSARLIEQQGFPALYVSGGAFANSVGGVPDVGILTLTESRDHIAHMGRATSIPIIADADTGYGGADNATRTVQLLEAAGCSAIHLEDQEFPKRCGHLSGKRLVPADEFCIKLQTAASAKTSEDFVLIARTDARGVEGYDEAVRRAHLYLEAGADAIFPEALQSEEEWVRFAQDVDGLLLANMTEFGKTPYFTADVLSDMGYDMVIYPVTMQRIAMKAVERALKAIKAERSQQSILGDMQTRAELYDLLGYDVAVPKVS